MQIKIGKLVWRLVICELSNKFYKFLTVLRAIEAIKKVSLNVGLVCRENLKSKAP